MRSKLPPLTDTQILARPDIMDLVAAVAQRRIPRTGASPTAILAGYLLDGTTVLTLLDLRLLECSELIRVPISGPPALLPRGERLLRMDGWVRDDDA